LFNAPENLTGRASLERRLEELVDAIYRIDQDQLGSSAPEEQVSYEKAPLDDILDMTFPTDPSLRGKVREQVRMTVSQLPLEERDAVISFINFFSSTKGRRILLGGMQRSGRYKAMIERVLAEEGLPEELIFLAQAESGFLPRAVSNKLCMGIWQFAKFRGNEYGLKQTPATDDRMDPEKATRAAAHHLRDLYQEFGDWYLAIAAYNCGPGNVERAVERTGYADFWELRSRGALPAETTNYVPIILAMTIMEKNAAEYGIEGFQLDPPLEYDTVETIAPTSLTLVADILDMPFAELAALNPASLRGMVPDNFSVHVPKGSGNQLVAAMQLIPANRLDAWRMHRVGSGETLATIGKRYGVTPTNIIAVNRLEAAQAVEGDRLLIPSVQRLQVTPPAAKKTVTATARRKATTRGKATTTASTKPARKKPVIVAHNR